MKQIRIELEYSLQEIADIYDHLSDFWNIAEEERMNIAIQIFQAHQLRMQNEIFKKAFVITDSDAYPTALEAIAIANGYDRKF